VGWVAARGRPIPRVRSPEYLMERDRASSFGGLGLNLVDAFLLGMRVWRGLENDSVGDRPEEGVARPGEYCFETRNGAGRWTSAAIVCGVGARGRESEWDVGEAAGLEKLEDIGETGSEGSSGIHCGLRLSE
jgi:hypothetical protein